jgi:hypothetical protein
MPLATTESRTDIEGKRRNMTGFFQFAEIQLMLENLGLWSGAPIDRQYAYHNGTGDFVNSRRPKAQNGRSVRFTFGWRDAISTAGGERPGY